MTGHITALTTYDVRFPTSRGRHGSDAMNPEPDYSAAYVVIGTDSGVDGHGLAFTIGRGNDIQVAAIRALEPYVAGHSLEETVADMGGLSRRMVHESPLRWLGPEKGVMHMAIGAVINAVWDLKARLEGKPLWQLLAAMSPEELVGLVDFRLGPILTQIQMAQNIRQLIDLIQSTIEPSSWEANGRGGLGTIVFYPATMSLIVKQTAEVHYKLSGTLP